MSSSEGFMKDLGSSVKALQAKVIEKRREGDYTWELWTDSEAIMGYVDWDEVNRVAPRGG